MNEINDLENFECFFNKGTNSKCNNLKYGTFWALNNKIPVNRWWSSGVVERSKVSVILDQNVNFDYLRPVLFNFIVFIDIP